MSASPTQTDQQAEIEALRARVAALERELVEQAERTGRVVAAAQQRTYWLDRWNVDLDALMRRRGASEARAAFRLARLLMRAVKRARRALARES